MGTLIKKTYARHIPNDAERFQEGDKEYARWKARGGRTITAEIQVREDCSEYVITKSGVYMAEYRDGSGKLVVVSTGCKDRGAAMAVLAKLERRAEKVRSGVVTMAEDRASDWLDVPLNEMLEDYSAHLKAKGVSKRQVPDRKQQLNKIFTECGFGTLRDIDRTAFERWINLQAEHDMGAARRNVYHSAIVAFCNWAVSAQRLLANPLINMKKASEQADRRHVRRAFTPEELQQLITAAIQRPLANAMTVQNGDDKGKPLARVSDEQREWLISVGREHAMIYKTLVGTGLRRGELAAITVGDVCFDKVKPFISLGAAHEKSRRGACIWLNNSLAKDIADHLDLRLKALRKHADLTGKPIPCRLPLNTPLFDVPKTLSRVLDKDMEYAGIQKTDERGRVLDVHAFRMTFCSNMAAVGIPLQTAQVAMRHSDPKLTANVYTDIDLLDVRSAMNSLPELSMNDIDKQNELSTEEGGSVSE